MTMLSRFFRKNNTDMLSYPPNAAESCYRSLVRDFEPFTARSREDYEVIAETREEIHSYLKNPATKLHDKYNSDVLESDQLLQEHILKELKRLTAPLSLDKFRKKYFSQAPRSHWWLWLDRLNKLSEKQRSTL